MRKGTYFESGCKDYVDATKITGQDKVVQLLEWCDEQLQKDLTRSAGGSLTSKTEQEILSAMKKLAVHEENTMVAVVTLHNMCQDREETVQSFHARLHGQAGICKFLTNCPGCNPEVNYTESVLHDVITKGIADPEIQLHLLSSSNQDMSQSKQTTQKQNSEPCSGKKGHGRSAPCRSHSKKRMSSIWTQMPTMKS